jgi:hypothetical protein
VNAELGAQSPSPGDLESALLGGLYASEISGFYTKLNGQLTGGFTPNPYFGLNGAYAGAVGLLSTASSFAVQRLAWSQLHDCSW